MDTISTTELQKNPKKVIDKKPIQMILTNNKVSGLLLSADVAHLMEDSGLLQQIREELFELQDKETVSIIQKHRAGKSRPVSFDEFQKKYDL